MHQLQQQQAMIVVAAQSFQRARLRRRRCCACCLLAMVTACLLAAPAAAAAAAAGTAAAASLGEGGGGGMGSKSSGSSSHAGASIRQQKQRQQQQQQQQQQQRKLLASVRLFCNVTGACAPCAQQHMQSEACRPTLHAERLSCATTDAGPGSHEVVLSLHRRVKVASEPLHISRGCSPPSQAKASAAAAAAEASEPMAAAAITQHDAATGEVLPAAYAFAQPRLAGVGALNVLYFELVMVLILCGSLPAVYIRKRRYVRL